MCIERKWLTHAHNAFAYASKLMHPILCQNLCECVSPSISIYCNWLLYILFVCPYDENERKTYEISSKSLNAASSSSSFPSPCYITFYLHVICAQLKSRVLAFSRKKFNIILIECELMNFLNFSLLFSLGFRALKFLPSIMISYSNNNNDNNN